jgi:predicted dithiol-disulfide oxidoreductase (DUF899 family)
VSFDESDRENGKVNYNYKRQEFANEEAPGVSVFKRNAQGEIFHTYSTYSRGLDMLNGAYHYLDIVPADRDESELAWKMAWLSRNDVYRDNGHS